jgi:hypothetical protein
MPAALPLLPAQAFCCGNHAPLLNTLHLPDQTENLI